MIADAHVERALYVDSDVPWPGGSGFHMSKVGSRHIFSS